MKGALIVPQWPVVAAVAASLAHVEDPIAVCDRRVKALSPAAHRHGIQIGDTRRHASYLCPDIVLIDHDERRDDRYFSSVLDAVEEHIAHATVVRPGLMTFAADPPARSAGGYEKLAEELIGSLAEKDHECFIGYGQGTLTAILAARAGRIVAENDTTRFLNPHPLTSILHAAGHQEQASRWEEIISVLAGLGVSTIGQLRELDPSLLVSRFGTTGQEIYQLATGGDTLGPQWTDRSDGIAASRHVDIATATQATFLAKELSDEISEKLARDMVICGSLTVRARFAQGQERSRTWSMSEASSARDFTDRVRWQIAGWLDGDTQVGELTFLELLASDLSPAGERAIPLFGSRHRDSDSVTKAILKVQGLIGEDSVQSVALCGSRYPAGAVTTENWTPSPHMAVEHVYAGGIPKPWPTVVFPTPPRLEVHCRCGGALYVDSLLQLACQSCEHAIPGQLRVLPLSKAEPCHTHATCYYPGVTPLWNYAGPWHISGQWWSKHAYHRAYLQVDITPPALIYREGNGWFLEGIYS